jgi:membrane-associated protease RseP (regulator of RpoE activity)
MTGPKHLWSGNWQQESTAAQDDLADRGVPEDEEPSTPAPPSERTARRRLPRPAWLALGAIVLVAAGVVALAGVGGSSGPRAPTALAPAGVPAIPTTPSPTTPSPTTPNLTTPSPAATTTSASARPVRWLGMELVTGPGGGATVETVALGSEGDRAGLSTGDVILAINHRQVSDVEGIAPAIRGLHRGNLVPLQISHGSSLLETAVTLAAPPSAYP